MLAEKKKIFQILNAEKVDFDVCLIKIPSVFFW